jgi:hypothetical protein
LFPPPEPDPFEPFDPLLLLLLPPLLWLLK